MIDLDPLLAPIDGPDSCGPLLEYDLAFLALERAATHVPEQRLGAAVRPAVPPDWREVESLACGLLRRTKDWRVARLLLQAWLNREGLAGMARGLELLAGLANAFGAEVHPTNEEDGHDGVDSTSFLALALEGDGGVLADVRALPLRAGTPAVTVGAIERAIADTTESEARRAALQFMGEDGRRCLPELVRCATAIGKFDTAMHCVWSPLDELSRVVTALQKAATPWSAAPANASAPPVPVRQRHGRPARLTAKQSPPDTEALTAALPLLDLETLIAACDHDLPCGQNLEYEPRSIELFDALRGHPEQQFGDVLIDAVPPDWPRVSALALQWMALARDLRPAVAWTRAATWLYGVEGTAAGLSLIAALLAAHPLDVHPQLDTGDDDPSWERRIALHPLGAAGGLPADLLAVWGGDGPARTGAEDSTLRALNRALDALREIQHRTTDGTDDEPLAPEGLEQLLLRLKVQLAPAESTAATLGRISAAGDTADGESPSVDVMRAIYETLCARLGPPVDDELCARAQRLSALRYDDIERGLVRGSAAEADRPWVPR